jgi:hypothetical protein
MTSGKVSGNSAARPTLKFATKANPRPALEITLWLPLSSVRAFAS